LAATFTRGDGSAAHTPLRAGHEQVGTSPGSQGSEMAGVKTELAEPWLLPECMSPPPSATQRGQETGALGESDDGRVEGGGEGGQDENVAGSMAGLERVEAALSAITVAISTRTLRGEAVDLTLALSWARCLERAFKLQDKVHLHPRSVAAAAAASSPATPCSSEWRNDAKTWPSLVMEGSCHQGKVGGGKKGVLEGMEMGRQAEAGIRSVRPQLSPREAFLLSWLERQADGDDEAVEEEENAGEEVEGAPVGLPAAGDDAAGGEEAVCGRRRHGEEEPEGSRHRGQGGRGLGAGGQVLGRVLSEGERIRGGRHGLGAITWVRGQQVK